MAEYTEVVSGVAVDVVQPSSKGPKKVRIVSPVGNQNHAFMMAVLAACLVSVAAVTVFANVAFLVMEWSLIANQTDVVDVANTTNQTALLEPPPDSRIAALQELNANLTIQARQRQDAFGRLEARVRELGQFLNATVSERDDLRVTNSQCRERLHAAGEAVRATEAALG